MKLTHIAIRRPVTTVMFFVSLVVVGAIASRLLPLEQWPDVDVPFIFVQVPYPGSSPEEVERLITRPLEEVLATMSGIQEMNSQSRPNEANVFLEFEWGTDITIKSITAREKLDGIREQLPDDIQRIKLNHDLITRRLDDEGEWIEATSDPQQRIEFVLAEIGLDIIESKEERIVLVAQYDGRRLKPWREIQAPVLGRKVQAGIMNGSSSAGCSARDHIRSFNLQHDYRLTAKRPVLINETGLPDETPLSEITVSWHGPGALKIAQRWFEEEFGITFVEERRVMLVFTVKRRE